MAQQTGYRLWIEGENGTFIGRGRIKLLLQIQETGSISKAAKSLNMSYKKAWNLVDSMNREVGEDLVLCQSGGSGGGGTRLTDRGIRAIEQFEELEKKVSEFIQSQSKGVKF